MVYLASVHEYVCMLMNMQMSIYVCVYNVCMCVCSFAYWFTYILICIFRVCLHGTLTVYFMSTIKYYNDSIPSSDQFILIDITCFNDHSMYLILTMVYRWLYTYSPIFCIEFVSKLSRQSVSPSTDHKFASSLSVNCHDSHFHRLPTMKFASSLSVNCHDSQFHRLPTISWTDGR